MNLFESNERPKLGLLGGGQLGYMLLPTCLRYGVESYVMDGLDAPCAPYATRFLHGSPLDEQEVMALGKKVDTLTIEIEAVNTDALKRLEALGKKVYPSASVIELIQDKGKQKEFLSLKGFPTAEFTLSQSAPKANEISIPFPMVQKLRKGGYDGKGVKVLSSEASLSDAFDAPCVLETKIDIAKELSVLVCRDQKGEIKAYPPVEMIFHPELNLLDYLYCPAPIESDMSIKATTIAKDIAEAIDIVGLLAVEMFIDKSGNLFVNELAPRAHNSGHHTIEACATSQFEQHLRAVMGLPLGSTELLKPALMLNLLGEPGHFGVAKCVGLEEALCIPNVSVHWYQKRVTRPGRKMGHVTILTESLEEGLEKARKVQQCLKVVAE